MMLAQLLAACGTSVYVIDDTDPKGAGGRGSSVTTASTAVTTTATGGNTSGTGPGGCDTAGAGPGSEALPPIVGEQCSQVENWQTVCLTIGYGSSLFAFELETGLGCNVMTFEEFRGGINSMAVINETIMACGLSEDVLYRLDMQTGEVESVQGACHTITSSEGRILLKRASPPDELVVYDSYQHYLCSRDTILPVDDNNSVIGAWGGTLCTAWHSTNELNRYALPVGGTAELVQLQGFDGWVHGIAPLEDGRIVILSQGEVYTFDPSGAALAVLQGLPLVTPGGLRCWSN
jgi:hypothetical protein